MSSPVERAAHVGRAGPAAVLSANTRGALLVLAAAACYATMGACIKWLSARDFAESQMLLFRAVAGFLLLGPALLGRNKDFLRSPRPHLLIRHSIAWGVGAVVGFYAAGNLPLANAQALTFARSLFVVLLAVFLFNERIEPARLIAVGLGFVGVLFIAKPTSLALDLPTVCALTSAALVAYCVFTLKDLAKDHPISSIVAWSNGGSAVCALPLAFLAWRTPSFAEAGVFALLTFVGLAGQSLYSRGAALGDATLMTLVEYMRLPFGVLIGFWIFSERVDFWTALGGLIIVCSTAFITIYEARQTRRAVKTITE